MEYSVWTDVKGQVFVSSPIPMLKPNPQCESIWRWTLRDNRVRISQEDGALVMGLLSFIRRDRGTRALHATSRYIEKAVACESESGLSPAP